MARNQPWSTDRESEEHWISISDLMAGLMAVFLFIAISYMLRVKQQVEIYEDVVNAYDDVRVRIYEELEREFKDSLAAWDAEIEPSLVVRFNEPEVLFEAGQATIQQRFKRILDSFFPRYIAILTRTEFQDEVSEVRIEGHTSSEWREDVGLLDAYLNNMDLSQARTSAVLRYVLGDTTAVKKRGDWARGHVVSIGFSSSRLRFTDGGEEDVEASRRVEFRIQTNAQARLDTILRLGREQSLFTEEES